MKSGRNPIPQITIDFTNIKTICFLSDLLRMRPDGYFEIVGRKKDMIIRGGENIFPK